MTILPEAYQHLSVVDEPCLSLSDAKRAELVRREAKDDANPEDVVPWEQAKAAIVAGLGGS